MLLMKVAMEHPRISVLQQACQQCSNTFRNGTKVDTWSKGTMTYVYIVRHTNRITITINVVEIKQAQNWMLYLALSWLVDSKCGHICVTIVRQHNPRSSCTTRHSMDSCVVVLELVSFDSPRQTMTYGAVCLRNSVPSSYLA
jgi:hypothetical protein